jgi:hypothetical protein
VSPDLDMALDILFRRTYCVYLTITRKDRNYRFLHTNPNELTRN